MFHNFHYFFKNKEYNSLDKLLSNDFSATSFNGTTMYKKEYLDYIKGWNKAFDIKWNVMDIKEVGDQIVSIEYDTDEFNNFIYDTIKPTKYIYSFKENTISAIDIDSVSGHYLLENRAKQKMEKFIKWVYSNHYDKISYFGKYDFNAGVEIKKLILDYKKSNL